VQTQRTRARKARRGPRGAGERRVRPPLPARGSPARVVGEPTLGLDALLPPAPQRRAHVDRVERWLQFLEPVTHVGLSGPVEARPTRLPPDARPRRPRSVAAPPRPQGGPGAPDRPRVLASRR